MAANSRKKFVLIQKASNRRVPSNDQKPKINPIPQMSPEAMRALGMVREDAKENLRSAALNPEPKVAMSDNDEHSYHGANFDNNNNDNTSESRNTQNGITDVQRKNLNRKRVQRPPPGQNAKANLSKMLLNNTARTRSTHFHTDAPFSTSDNTDSSCNQTTITSSASVYTNNNSTSQSGNVKSDNNNFRKPVALPADEDDYDDADNDNDEIGSLTTEQDFTNGNALLIKEKSFVLALDRALERKSISRLKGDITDTSRIHKPGTVRALDGGRLANAQEVVVNVCHNDDRQLVFHDDDEESLDTAKEISQIRVNIWMEYNSEFPPDNDVHDVYGFADTENASTSSIKSHSTRLPNNTSSEKTTAGSRKNQGSSEGGGNNTKDRTFKNKNYANDKLNKNVPASLVRPKSAVLYPKSAMSGSSGSSKEASQNGPSSTKRTPINARTRK